METGADPSFVDFVKQQTPIKKAVPAAFESLVSKSLNIPQEEPPDYTGRYNTTLTPEEEAAYGKWVSERSAAAGRDIGQDTYDYDLRGAWQANAESAANGHMPDTYKKPNHPTFSDQSRYHGVDGAQGGTWGKEGDAPPFYPSQHNVKNMGSEELLKYFEQFEKNSPVYMPPSNKVGN